MDKTTKERLVKELRVLFVNGNTEKLAKEAVKELSDFTGTDITYIFQKLTYVVDLLSKLTEGSAIIPNSFNVSLSAISVVFKILGTKLKSSSPPVEKDATYLALLRYQNSELKAEAVGLEDLLFTTHAYLNEIDEHAHESVVIRLEERFPTNDTVRFLGKLKAKAQELLTTSEIPSARRASVYINLYFRLAILRTMVLWQVFCIKERSGYDEASTRAVLAMINEGQKSDLEVVRYVTETSFQKVVFHTIFHPTENENFLHFLQIQQYWIPNIGQDLSFCRQTHCIRSSKKPEIKFERTSMLGGRIRGGSDMSSDCKFQLEPLKKRRVDNVFYIRSAKSPGHYVYMHDGGNCFSASHRPGPEGQWKIVQFENDKSPPQYVLSPLKWPCRFLFLKSFLGSISIAGTYSSKETKDKGLWEILDL